MKQLKKTCERCGVTQRVPSRRRRCHERVFGTSSYWCYGKLVTVQRRKRVVPIEQQRTKIQNALFVSEQELHDARNNLIAQTNVFRLAKHRVKRKMREVKKLKRQLAKLPVEETPKRAIKVTGSV